MAAFLSFQSGFRIGVPFGVAGGCIFGLVIAAFVRYQGSRSRTNPPNFIDEELLEEGPANHFLNGEGVGGWLYLTTRRLYFRSHRLNIQNHELSIPIAEIVQLSKGKSLGFIPNLLRVQLPDGKTESFVVNKVDYWIGLINDLETA